jgi:hypothetical protein
MAERFTDRIRRYCEAHGIDIPVGFGRHPASRYAVIEHTDPPRLVARTWFNQEDVIYYLEHQSSDGPRLVLDFKEWQQLAYQGGRLIRGELFTVDWKT